MKVPDSELIKRQARELGFVISGVTACATPGRLQHLHRWLDSGYAGQMTYLENRREAYADPTHVLDGCRSIVMLGMPYATATVEPDTTRPVARVARYAAGQLDYHDVIHARLKRLKEWLLAAAPDANVRGVVDTAPLLEREFAELAGLGWVGKNTLLLNRQWGSYFFLAALLTDLPLSVDDPHEHNYCGTCTACLQACPTDAFVEPYVLDATKCISYLTIEHRGPVADSLRDGLGDWAFGCDVCQEVCPWNAHTERVQPSRCIDPALEPRDSNSQIDLLEVLKIGEEAFRAKFRKTPLWRSRRRGILRNAILCAVNQDAEVCEPVIRELLDDPEPLLRSAATWAVGRFGKSGWRELIDGRLLQETDEEVREQMRKTLATGTATGFE